MSKGAITIGCPGFRNTQIAVARRPKKPVWVVRRYKTGYVRRVLAIQRLPGEREYFKGDSILNS